MEKISEGVSLSDRELFYLGTLLQGQQLIGIPEPFPGWLTEEIEELLPEIEHQLQTRGIVHEAADGGMSVEAALEPALRALVLCDVAVIVTSATPQMAVAEQRIFYFKRPHLAELHGPETRDDARFYTLHVLDGYPATIYERLVEWWAITQQPAPECAPVTLQESDLAQVRRLAVESGSDAATTFLAAKGVNDETAAALAETMATAKKNGALVINRHSETGWQMENSGLLEGGNGLWRLHSLERGDQRLVECIPCAAETLRGELQTLLGHFVYGA